MFCATLQSPSFSYSLSIPFTNKQIKGVKKHELESKGFFSRGWDYYCKRIRIHYTVVRSILLAYHWLESELDTWRWFLTFLGLWFFFGFIFGVALVYLGLLYGGIYGYAWGGLWLSVSSLLAYHEVCRRMKAEQGKTNYYNPNAIKEYLEIPSVKRKAEQN